MSRGRICTREYGHSGPCNGFPRRVAANYHCYAPLGPQSAPIPERWVPRVAAGTTYDHKLRSDLDWSGYLLQALQELRAAEDRLEGRDVKCQL